MTLLADQQSERRERQHIFQRGQRMQEAGVEVPYFLGCRVRMHLARGGQQNGSPSPLAT